ncbi:hypothetical protein Pcinc_018460 [Petrolisthes cinctipes]|uniref:Uncharacterized protein n=1 Tax=Petrolisthes cinctipes TaxID=88211 RepID=A0AAE1FS21_PETCI|nr:hypothetical protein Pcinc_018460 [Petrolisthes cinctipes]
MKWAYPELMAPYVSKWEERQLMKVEEPWNEDGTIPGGPEAWEPDHELLCPPSVPESGQVCTSAALSVTPAPMNIQLKQGLVSVTFGTETNKMAAPEATCDSRSSSPNSLPLSSKKTSDIIEDSDREDDNQTSSDDASGYTLDEWVAFLKMCDKDGSEYDEFLEEAEKNDSVHVQGLYIFRIPFVYKQRHLYDPYSLGPCWLPRSAEPSVNRDVMY